MEVVSTRGVSSTGDFDCARLPQIVDAVETLAILSMAASRRVEWAMLTSERLRLLGALGPMPLASRAPGSRSAQLVGPRARGVAARFPTSRDRPGLIDRG